MALSYLTSLEIIQAIYIRFAGEKGNVNFVGWDFVKGVDTEMINRKKNNVAPSV